MAAVASALGILLLVAWSSPAAILNAWAARGDYKVSREIAYAPGSRKALDVYAPAVIGEKRASIVLFLYGGGWEDGDKSTYLFVGAALAARGFVTIIPNYRVYPEVRFPAFVEDAALAMRWARDHASEFGGDPDRMVLMGHSAGAHIAAMLTFDRQWLADVGLDPRRHLKAMVGLAGPYDFLPLHSDTLKAIFGPENRLAASQPINFVDGAAPRVFLATGRADDTVDPGNTTRLADRIRTKGGVAIVKIYDHVGHATLIGAFAGPLRPLAPVLRDATRFLHDAIAETASGTRAAQEGVR